MSPRVHPIPECSSLLISFSSLQIIFQLFCTLYVGRVLPPFLVGGGDGLNKLQIQCEESLARVHLLCQHTLHLLLRHRAHTTYHLDPLSGGLEGGREVQWEQIVLIYAF